MLARITLGGLCFGLVVDGTTINRAAPVAGWSRGKDWKQVEDYFRKRGAKIEVVSEI